MDGALSSDPSIPHPVETIDDASQKKTKPGLVGLEEAYGHPLRTTSYLLCSKGGKSTVCLAGPRVYRSCPATVVDNSVPTVSVLGGVLTYYYSTVHVVQSHLMYLMLSASSRKSTSVQDPRSALEATSHVCAYCRTLHHPICLNLIPTQSPLPNRACVRACVHACLLFPPDHS